MSGCKKPCTTRCQRTMGVEIVSTPKVLCAPAKKHSCDIPISLDVEIKPKCSIRQAACQKQTSACHTRCNYTLTVDLDVIPNIQCSGKHTCQKEFDFEVMVEHQSKCLNGRQVSSSSSSSSSASCAPCKKAHPKGCSCRACKK